MHREENLSLAICEWVSRWRVSVTQEGSLLEFIDRAPVGPVDVDTEVLRESLAGAVRFASRNASGKRVSVMLRGRVDDRLAVRVGAHQMTIDASPDPDPLEIQSLFLSAAEMGWETAVIDEPGVYSLELTFPRMAEVVSVRRHAA